MSTNAETQSRRERTWVWVVAVVVLVVLAAVALFSFLGARQSARATDKAEELLASFTQAGISVSFTPAQVAQVLGTDGGATCANPNAALSRATLLATLSNGAGGPGMRPVIADSKLLQGQLLIIKTYCPEAADDFQKFIDSLNTTTGDGS